MNTLQRNTKMQVRWFSWSLILLVIISACFITLRNVEAKNNSYVNYNIVNNQVSGVSVIPVEASYQGKNLYVKCEVKNLTGRSLSQERFEVKLFNKNGVIATGIFYKGLRLNPGQAKYTTLIFDENHCVSNANLDTLRWEVTSTYT